jgi:hypothetical protein
VAAVQSKHITSSQSHPWQANRRREPRYPTPDTAEVVILSDLPFLLSARVLDVSQTGLRVSIAASLGEGTKVKITFRRPAIIVGEVRHCKRVGDLFHVGIKIHEVLISPNRHVDEDELALYLSGKGLTEPEFFYIRLHFAECEGCQRRLRERETPAG